jgi:UDP-N-acetyl-D-glucosamine dehydrogenase
MPEYVVHKISNALNDDCKSLKGSQILILGVTYKADIGDMRESPALDIMHILHEQGAKVAYHDPHAPRVLIDGWSIATVELTSDVLQAADCVVITTAHSAYDWQWVVDNSRLVIDTRNVTARLTPGAGRIVKL